MTSYQVQINMEAATLEQLSKSNYTLYGFLAAQVSDGQALPLLWYASRRFTQQTVVQWTNQYQAYTSASVLTSGQPVSVGTNQPMNPGQLLTVDATGTGSLANTGEPGYFSVFNTSTSPQVCGLLAGSPPAVFVGLPLNGGSVQVFAPAPKVLLLFSTASCPLGTALAQWQASSGPVILVDLSDATQRIISYDLNTGWNWNNEAWGQLVPQGQTLTTSLLSQPPALRSLVTSLMARIGLAVA